MSNKQKMSKYKFKVVTPTCTGIVPHLWMALNFSNARNQYETGGIYIYTIPTDDRHATEELQHAKD